MRALVADPSATPAVALADVPEPSPGNGELLLRMEAASVNRGEVRNAAAKPAGTVIGWDVVGTVIATGPGVDEVRSGDRVLALSPGGGTFAEQVVVPAAWATPLPAGSDPIVNSALPVAGLTAVNILRLTRTHAGDRVLVTGAAGGVGCLAVQLAVDAKCDVTGQVGSSERAGFVTGLGARALVHQGDGADVDGEFDVIVDGIGGPMFAPLLRALTFKGRMLVYGNSAGGESTFNVEDLYPKAVSVQGFRVFQSVPPDQGSRDLGMLAELVANGRLKVNVQASAPLADGLGLLADLMDRKVTGKVVLTGSE